MNRVHALLRLLGPAGICAVGGLVACVALYFSALRPAERELARLRMTPSSTALHEADGPAPLARFRAHFPPADQLTDELQRIYKLARAAGLDLMQGEYRVERRIAGLTPYRISLPVRGSYAAVRQFVGATLAEVPFASIDTLRFERRKSGDAQLEAQVRITIYFRASQDLP